MKLELRFHPPLIAAIVAALMWVLDAAVPLLGFAVPWRRVSVLALLVAGVACALAGIFAFRRAQTTINPHRPLETSRLVDWGIYRYTRNPMYLGMLLVLAAWSMQLASLSALAGLPLFVWYLTRFQILPEEHALRGKFGDAFDRYAKAVRRWL